jgi:hypothetical protein
VTGHEIGHEIGHETNHETSREGGDVDDRLVLDNPLSAAQIRTAARALGFQITVGSDRGDGDAPGGSPHTSEREISLLLAALDAVVVRCMVDQDVRDPTDHITRGQAAMSAQTELSAGTEDTLVAALRRVQSVAGLVHGTTDPTDVHSPGQAITHLLNAAGLLVAAWLTQIMRQTRVGGDGQAELVLSLPDISTLADSASRTLAVATDELSAWLQSDRPS